ncbi:hypothetical protein ACIQAD_22980 [Streptomyces sp. NPDC088551]|uniref:hypothetical protein n=1 Tax=Streptomyces sp. NPDC088551 TaxID=3365863 RepID=UPI00380D48ED
MHRTSRQSRSGGGVGVLLGGGVSGVESSAGGGGGGGGGVVGCAAGGRVVGESSAAGGVVCGRGLVVAVGRVAAVVCRGFLAAVLVTTVVDFRGGLVIAGGGVSPPESRGSRVLGRTDDESVSVASAPVVAVAFGSGVADACVSWPVDGRDGSTARVRPPPTSATVDATTARRRCFFQRASWRRRAARPGVTGAVSSKLLDVPASGASATESITASSGTPWAPEAPGESEAPWAPDAVGSGPG